MLLMASALLVGLAAGCGTKNDTAPSSGGSTNEQSPSNEQPSSGEGLTGEFEIQYFVGGYGDAGWKRILKGFQEKHPNLKIVETAGSKINEQTKPRWIKGDPPDFVYIDGAGSNATQMVADDQLLDLTEYVKTAKNTDGDLIMDQLLLQPIDYSGKTYTLPFVFGSWGVFYDQQLFEDNGWQVPTDFDSFMSVSQTIKDSGKVNAPMIFTGQYPYYFHGGLLDSAFVVNNNYDTNILKDMAALKEGIFKSDAVKKSLDQMVQIRDAGYIDQASAALNHTDSQMLFLQHKNAFIPNGLWLENEMKKDVPANFKFSFMPSITQPKDGKSVAIPFTATVGISKKAKNPEAAKAFMEYLFTKESAIAWAEETGALGNLRVDLENSKASDLVKTAINFYNMDSTIVAPFVELNADVDKVKQDSTLALMIGNITPEEWMERMEEAAAKSRE